MHTSFQGEIQQPEARYLEKQKKANGKKDFQITDQHLCWFILANVYKETLFMYTQGQKKRYNEIIIKKEEKKKKPWK